MKITEQWLEENRACREGVRWFKRQDKTNAVDVLNALIADDKPNWANWTIVRVMVREQYIAYAIFAAEQVLDIYAKKYPDDDRPRKAIEAAKVVQKNPSKKNAACAACAADAAAAAAACAACAADAAAAADACAAYAADAAAAAAYAAAAAAAAAYAAAAAAYAAAAAAACACAADAAAYANAKAQKEMRLRIVNYGLSLLTGGKPPESGAVQATAKDRPA